MEKFLTLFGFFIAIKPITNKQNEGTQLISLVFVSQLCGGRHGGLRYYIFFNVVAYIIKWSVFFFFFVYLIVDGIGDPIWSLGHSVVDTGLTAFCTWVTGWHDAYKGPPALNFGHERTPRIPLTRVFAPTIVASTDHFVIDYDVDALVSMPSLTLSIFNHRNIHNLKKLQKKVMKKILIHVY